MNSPARFPSPRRTAASAFTLLELMVAIGIMAIIMTLVVPAVKGINGSRGLTRGINDVSGILELARAEAMATRSYVYVGFANTTNSDGNSELRIGAVISIDGSSSTAASNLRAVSKLSKIANVRMTDYNSLPQVVKSAADTSLQTSADYVINFTPQTSYLQGKFNDRSLDTCPTLAIAPQGEVLNLYSPTVFFRTTSSVGLVPTHGTNPVTTDGAIVSYYGGTGQLRVTRPL
ncbi:MAG: Tfp pilus assembly protein FimT/FimU [Chthoniobacterales bacterium]